MPKFEQKDVDDSKVIAALSYIWILFLVPLLVKKDSPDEIETFSYAAPNGTVGILQLLCDTKLVDSKGEARRLIEQGGVSVDGMKIADINASVQLLRPVIVKVGRRRFLKIVPIAP